MPEWKTLKAGDRVRLLCVPKSDLKQREHEISVGAEEASSTADTLEEIIASNPIVTINHVDEFGAPWFKRELTADDGTIHYHSLTITDDDSWEFVE
jgi:hypothetical protein